MASTRRASPISFCIWASMTATAWGLELTEQNLSTRSGAPFKIAKALPLPAWPCTVSIHLFSELKGISNNVWFSGFCLNSLAELGPPWTSQEARMMATSVGEPVHFSLPSSSRFNSAPLFKMPQTEMSSQGDLHVAGQTEPLSRTTTVRPSWAMVAADAFTTTKSWTVISPFVSVPVLSEQKTVTQPKVSTASILRTKTLRLTISAEANMREMVTVGSRPSGTCENKAHAVYWIMSATSACWTIFTQRLMKPTNTAIMAMKCTKCSIWISRVDLT
mmetsp:Transcript_99923/g.322094  ORF Transcript_99923/g.322094 Transcript_99923/m.322094 type:complete len:275 (+) Transcript_99923:427-1251(+)